MCAEEDIHRLLVDYCLLADDGALDAWVELFASGGVLDMPGRRLEGRDAVRVMIAGSDPAAIPTRKHLTLNSRIVVDGDAATACSDFMVVGPSSAGPVMLVAGRYDDRCVLEGGRWRFAERRVMVDRGFSVPGLQ